MMSPLVRARLLGGLVLILAFGAGTALGYSLPRREDDATIKVVVKETDRIPTEIEALGLSESQRGLVRGILRQGAGRVRGVMVDFEPRMTAAIDSTELEIRAVLTPEQRTALDEEHKKNPPHLIRHERVDTIRR